MNLLKNMDYDSDAPPSAVEQEVFYTLVVSLREQQQRLLNDPEIKDAQKLDLKTFENSLAELEGIGQKLAKAA